jgi:DNA-binding response OmpR family regulator
MKEKILFVEDNLITREALKDILVLKGYDVYTASDGLEALDVLEEVTPSLILSDIMMPNMNGYEFFEKVKSNPAWNTMPFIFLTAKMEREDVIRGKKLGADDYLTKPVDIDELIASIQGKLQRSKNYKEN